MINWIKKKLYGLNELNELEMLILDNIRSELSPEAINLWDDQVKVINKVQRLPHGVESDFYVIDLKTGKPIFDDLLRFPNKTEELLLATTTLKFESNKLDADIFCVNGRLFCITYKGSALYWIELIGSIDEYSNQIEVKTKIYENLMLKS
ncbi:hypothetical protein QE380_003024 [Acinetobacter baylyi]|uniref:Phage protein n=1 Tax=Acinetobacter baylyi TaxID=202950 RepID=A0ABU0V078_ACIBI|nr:hypothetical protein [Acinetobacter baylyi]MDQ1210101.1 hypothetical protein [Acinetobacter baylyi]MDR6106302.1 hypothetical protein [Acinetobacter baylyi]MDR6186971.1 hypothetical protein [Acinetobacter baylyi]